DPAPRPPCLARPRERAAEEARRRLAHRAVARRARADLHRAVAPPPRARELGPGALLRRQGAGHLAGERGRAPAARRGPQGPGGDAVRIAALALLFALSAAPARAETAASLERDGDARMEKGQYQLA